MPGYIIFPEDQTPNSKHQNIVILIVDLRIRFNILLHPKYIWYFSQICQQRTLPFKKYFLKNKIKWWEVLKISYVSKITYFSMKRYQVQLKWRKNNNLPYLFNFSSFKMHLIFLTHLKRSLTFESCLLRGKWEQKIITFFF